MLLARLAKTEAFAQTRRGRKKVEMLFAHLKRILRLEHQGDARGDHAAGRAIGAFQIQAEIPSREVAGYDISDAEADQSIHPAAPRFNWRCSKYPSSTVSYSTTPLD